VPLRDPDEDLADLIAPRAGLGLGCNGGCDRCRLQDLKERRLDGIVNAQSAERDAARLTVVELAAVTA
jgi:hypothetical protein